MQPSAIIALSVANVLIWGTLGFVLGYRRGFERG